MASQPAYIESQEQLYFLCRLDRYTPATARFISWGAEVITPLTQAELMAAILETFPRTNESARRRLHSVGGETHTNMIDQYHRADNNHSGYWRYGFVHAVGKPVTFWNLDGPLEDVLRETFSIDEKAGAALAREFIHDLLDHEYDATVAEKSELSFLQWLEERRAELPPTPDMENYDSAVSDKYYDAIEGDIFRPLSDRTEFNADLIALLSHAAAGGDDKAARLKDSILRTVVSDIFPKNTKAGGYIINGFRTMIPNDAMHHALFAGNVEEVLTAHSRGEPILPENTVANAVYKASEANMRAGHYPKEMSAGMPSDWLSDGPYPDLAFKPRQQYPQLGWIDMLGFGYGKDMENGGIVRQASYEVLQRFRQAHRPPAPAPQN